MESRTGVYQPPRLQAATLLREYVLRSDRMGFEAKRNLQPVAWCSASTPHELFRAMGVVPVFPEAHAASCGVKKAAGPACEAAEVAGFPTDICSYVKVDIATALSGTSPIGRSLPPPDLFIGGNGSCSTITKWSELNARQHGAPVFMIDSPFSPGPSSDASAVGYVQQQLEELVSFLETHFGLRYDEARVRESLRLSRQAVSLWAEILDLCRHRPSPLNAFELWLHMTPITISRGTQECVDYYVALRAEVEQRVRDGVGAVPGERLRLLWDNLGLWLRLKELSHKFGSYGACVVSSTYSDLWLSFAVDPDKPLESLARSSLNLLFNHSLDYRIDFLVERIKKYSIDAVVIHSCRSCKPWFIGSYDLKEALTARTGVPVLIFEGDQIDPRYIADDQINSRIDAFMETLI